MADHLYVGSKKGLIVYTRDGHGWKYKATHFLGSPVSIVLPSTDNKTILCALNLGHFGVKLHRSTDGGETWKELEPPKFPKVEAADAESKEKAPSVKGIWSMAWGGADKPGQVWAGTTPGLFHSNDLGDTWQLNDPLWNMPEREKWFGGGTVDAALHSICVDPRNSNRVAIAVSCGGVTLTEDGGKTWKIAGEGLRAEYMPPDQQFNPVVQDPHSMVQSPSHPHIWWIQHHNGIFRSDNDLKSWEEIKSPTVSHFGFPVAVHPKDGNIAWFVPAKKDEFRYPVDGKVVVTRTKDGGKSFEILRKGLPQDNAFDLVYRHALSVDETGNRLAMGSTTGSLWSSDNGGEDWTLISAHLPPINAVRVA